MPSDGILNCLPGVTEEHLDNGLEVIVQEVRTAPRGGKLFRVRAVRAVRSANE